MKLQYLGLCILLTLSCTKRQKPNVPLSGPQHPDWKIVEQFVEHYNNYDYPAFAKLFNDNPQVAKSLGLGINHLVNGPKGFKKFYGKVFERKQNNIKITNRISLPPWFYTHQKITQHTNQGVRYIEAVVGYWIEDGKIKMVHVANEK